jgi:ClpP class serine protease
MSNEHLTAALVRAARLREPVPAELRTAAAEALAGHAVDPRRLSALIERLTPAMAWTIERDEQGDWTLGDPYRMLGRDDGTTSGVALMRIDAPIVGSASALDYLFMGVLPAGDVAEAIYAAAADVNIRTLAIELHTPGGTVSAMDPIAEAIAAYRESGKRLVALVPEWCMSLGLVLACGADECWITPSAVMGSAGVVLRRQDDSAFYERMGIKDKSIATSRIKLARAAAGVPIENQDDDRRIVELQAEAYFGNLAESMSRRSDRAGGDRRGRRWTAADVRAMDARHYCGTDAVAQGLATEVVPSMRSALARLTAAQTNDAGEQPAGGPGRGAADPLEPAPQEIRPMAIDRKNVSDADLASAPAEVVAKLGNQATPVPATLAELVAEIKDPALVVEALAGQMTLPKAKDLAKARADAQARAEADRTIADLKAQNEAAKARIAELEKSVASAAGAPETLAKTLAKTLGYVPPGADPVQPGIAPGARLGIDQDRAALARIVSEAQAQKKSDLEQVEAIERWHTERNKPIERGIAAGIRLEILRTL